MKRIKEEKSIEKCPVVGSQSNILGIGVHQCIGGKTVCYTTDSKTYLEGNDNWLENRKVREIGIPLYKSTVHGPEI